VNLRQCLTIRNDRKYLYYNQPQN